MKNNFFILYNYKLLEVRKLYFLKRIVKNKENKFNIDNMIYI